MRDEFNGLRTIIEGRERSNNPIADVSFPQGFFATGLPEPRLVSRTPRAHKEQKEEVVLDNEIGRASCRERV